MESLDWLRRREAGSVLSSLSTGTSGVFSQWTEHIVDSFRSSVSPDTRAFGEAILGKPDPDDCAAFLAGILGENLPEGDCPDFCGTDATRMGLSPSAPPTAWGDLTTGGSTDDWLFFDRP
jgi:hypothetical protein